MVVKWHPNEFSKLTNVSVRTLHHYDDIDLLKPSMRLQNGYRLYSESDLLKLQQIIALKYFGFELSQIKAILNQEMDALTPFQAQKAALKAQMSRLKSASNTLDDIINAQKANRSINWKTIVQLIEDYKMTHEIEKFWDHDMAQQTEYEKYLVSQGIVSQSEIDKGREKYKTWKKEDWQKFKHEGDEINNAILKALQKNLKPDSNEVQKLIKNHFEWVKRFWTPDREKYINLGKMYCTHADFEKYFEKFDPKFAKFLAQAMKVYAENNLS